VIVEVDETGERNSARNLDCVAVARRHFREVGDAPVLDDNANALDRHLPALRVHDRPLGTDYQPVHRRPIGTRRPLGQRMTGRSPDATAAVFDSATTPCALRRSWVD
jgi:hypothetical protein